MMTLEFKPFCGRWDSNPKGFFEVPSAGVELTDRFLIGC